MCLFGIVSHGSSVNFSDDIMIAFSPEASFILINWAVLLEKLSSLRPSRGLLR